MKRQVEIVKPDATPEEVEEVIKNGGGTGEIFKTAILKVYLYFQSFKIFQIL